MKKFNMSIVAVAMMVLVSPLLVSAEMLTRQLEFGMRGDDVSTLQSFLAKDATIYPQGLVTGYFGSMTKSAVTNFQARNGIATVGRVGPITMQAINAQMNTADSPMISAINVGTASTSATLNWNTGKNSSAIVYYSSAPISMTEASATSGVTIGGSSMLVHTDLRTSHSVTLGSLSPNTTYYYVVYVRDGAGNESVTWPATFKTAL